MKRILFKYLSIVLVIVILSVSYTNVSGSGHDFENGELRNDLSSVYNAMDYRVKIRSYIGPTIGYPDGTAGWLGFDLAQFDGTLYSGKFSQVGLFTRSNGITWFVYAEPGVTCLRGTPAWGTLGCIGAISDLSIAYGSERYVELQTQSGQGYWIAKVSNSIGQMVNVAYINYNSTRIYRAMVTMEEPYSVAQDPYLIASFYFFASTI